MGNNATTIHSSVLRSLRDVDQIGDYDWGSFTFALFLFGMHRRTETLASTWFGFFPFLLVGLVSIFFDFPFVFPLIWFSHDPDFHFNFGLMSVFFFCGLSLCWDLKHILVVFVGIKAC